MNTKQKEMDKRLLEIEKQARYLGFTIVVFTPDETTGSDLKQFESYLIQQGNEYLNLAD